MASHISQTSFTGTAFATKTNRSIVPKARSSIVTTALFTKKKPAPVVVEEPPAKKGGLFNFGASKKAAAQPAQKKSTGRVDKAAEYKKRQGVGGVISAFDFAEVRSKSDAELLYEAKYGKRDASGKMSREQYMALRRKIGGTAKDYWKTWIDVQGEYTDKGYVSTESTTVPGLPFLVITVVALIGAAGYVVSQTS